MIRHRGEAKIESTGLFCRAHDRRQGGASEGEGFRGGHFGKESHLPTPHLGKECGRLQLHCSEACLRGGRRTGPCLHLQLHCAPFRT